MGFYELFDKIVKTSLVEKKVIFYDGLYEILRGVFM